MSGSVRPVATILVTGAFLLLGAPAALANPVPVPGPEPGPVPGPVPVPTIVNNGVPMTAAGTQPGSSSTYRAYVDPVTNIPNINGDPCSGAWESVVCYSMQQGNVPVVQPRTTISSSP